MGRQLPLRTGDLEIEDDPRRCLGSISKQKAPLGTGLSLHLLETSNVETPIIEALSHRAGVVPLQHLTPKSERAPAEADARG